MVLPIAAGEFHDEFYEIHAPDYYNLNLPRAVLEPAILHKSAKQFNAVCEVPNPQWAHVGTTAQALSFFTPGLVVGHIQAELKLNKLYQYLLL